MTGPLGRSAPQVLCRGVGNDLLRPLPTAPQQEVPASLGRRTRFHGGGGYISSASYARRGLLVTTDGELHRPTSSRCTDGDATTAPILACRSRHFAWLRVGQSGHAELLGRGAPPPQRHAQLSGRPRSFPVSPMVRHSTSSHPPCRIRQSRWSGAGPRRGLCVARRGLSPTGTSRGPTPPSEGPCEGGTPTAAEHSGFTRPAARTRPCALLAACV